MRYGVVNSPALTGRGRSSEPTSRGEISRGAVVAEAETIRLPSYDIQRREFVESAWQFDEDTLEIECWVVSAGRPDYYTVRLPDGQRIGPRRAFSDGMFRVPALGPYGIRAPRRVQGGAPGRRAGRPAERSRRHRGAPHLRRAAVTQTRQARAS